MRFVPKKLVQVFQHIDMHFKDIDMPTQLQARYLFNYNSETQTLTRRIAAPPQGKAGDVITKSMISLNGRMWPKEKIIKLWLTGEWETDQPIKHLTDKEFYLQTTNILFEGLGNKELTPSQREVANKLFELIEEWKCKNIVCKGENV